jgi:chromosome segregation ATPase
MEDNAVDEAFSNAFNRKKKELRRELDRIESQIKSTKERNKKMRSEVQVARMEFDDLVERKNELKKDKSKESKLDRDAVQLSMQNTQEQIMQQNAAIEETAGQLYVLRSTAQVLSMIVDGVVKDQSELTLQFVPPARDPGARIRDTFRTLDDLVDPWADEE